MASVELKNIRKGQGLENEEKNLQEGLLEKQDRDLKKTPTAASIPFPSCRFVLTIMTFLTMINLYCMRVNLSIAIVAMINHTYVTSNSLESDVEAVNRTPSEVPCPVVGNVTQQSVKVDGPFEWSTKLQGVILGSFFYGYICTQFFGGIMAQKFGSKKLLLGALGLNSLLCLLTPVLTTLADAPMLIIIRILQGVFQGVSFPSAHGLISKWAPPLERSKIITFAYAGSQLGTVIANPVCGILAAYSWESIFYLFGALGTAFTIAFFFLIYDDPSQHPRIQPSEKEYIMTSLGGSKQKAVKLSELPWRSILTSIRLWATASAHFANNWGFYTMLTCLPTFFSQILKFDIKSNGAIAALPYLASWLLMVFSGWLADMLISKKILSTTKVRKLANVVGLMGPAICFIVTGYINCNNALAVFCIICAVGLSAISWAGWSVNHLDLAPLYAGTLMGLTNTLGTIPGFVGPAVAALFTAKEQTRAAWRNVFFLAAGINAFGAIFFCIFGSGEKQPWADRKEDKDKENKETKPENV